MTANLPHRYFRAQLLDALQLDGHGLKGANSFFENGATAHRPPLAGPSDLWASVDHAVNLHEIRSAGLALAAAGALRDRDSWFANWHAPLSDCARRHPELEPQIRAVYDEVNERAGGDTSDNDRQWNAAIRAAPKNPRTIGSLFHAAREVGWKREIAQPDSSAPPQVCGAVAVADLPRIPPKRRWRYGVSLISGAITLLIAPGGRGKSSLMISTAMACASGRPFLGDQVFGGPLRVLLLNAEDSLDELLRRIRAAMLHHKLTDDDVRGLFVAGAGNLSLSLLSYEKGQPKLNPAGWEALVAEINRLQPDILMLDPLVSLLGGVNVNDNAAAALLMGELARLAAERNIAIMIAHHARKGGEADNVESAMGAASLTNLARIALSIEPLSDEHAPRVGVDPLEARSYFRLVNTKANLAPPTGDDRWFKLASVQLDNAAPPLYPNGDQVAVVERFTPNPLASPYPPPVLQAVLDAIRKADPPLAAKLDKGTEGSLALLKAIGPYRKGLAADVRAIVSHLIDRGHVEVRQVQIKREGRGAYKRQGLFVTDREGSP